MKNVPTTRDQLANVSARCPAVIADLGTGIAAGAMVAHAGLVKDAAGRLSGAVATVAFRVMIVNM